MNKLLNCPVDCDTEFLYDAIPVEQDCTNYQMYDSQISDLYIIPNGASDIFASWSTTPTYVSGSIDNAETDNTKAKWLVGIGGVAVPEKQETQYPKKKSKITNRIFPLEFRVTNMVQAQYDFCRKLQCGATNFKFYYGNLSDFVFGKSGGLVPSKIDVDMPDEPDVTSKSYAIIRITWEADANPERKVNPHAS